MVEGPEFRDVRHQMGWDAEQLVADRLASQGWRIEAHRWKLGRHDLDLIARKAMDIVQPDLCAAGGFSECRKIAALASAFGVECVPHAWGSAIGLAATVQFLAALGDQPPAFRPMPPMLEFEQTPNPLRDRLATNPIEQKAGIVAVPEGPGLGIEIDRAILQQYKVA